MHPCFSDQLLALNAAIEAARAGEQGKLILEIQREITQAVHLMNKGTKEVEQGMLMAEETGDKFQSIFPL